jgi:hypothetical protein
MEVGWKMKRPIRPLLFIAIVGCVISLSASDDLPDRYTIRLPGKQWSVSMSIPGVKVERQATREDRSGIMMAGTHEETGINLSVFLELEKKPRTSDQCRKKYFYSSLSSALSKSDIERWETGPLAFGQYLVRIREIVEFDQMHMHAYLGEDGVCMDLHLSKVHFEDSDRQLFEKIFSSVRIERDVQK